MLSNKITSTRLLEVRTGKAASFANGKILSAIDKTPRSGPVKVGSLGVEGDEQADHRFHGGPDKAILHYAVENYDAWRSEAPAHPELFVPGGFGENFVSRGINETNICIGDTFRIGTAMVEVSQPRQPCFKLNHRFREAGMSRRVQSTGRTGWYYRVLSEGVAQEGDEITLLERRYPEWPLRRIQHHLYVDTLDMTAVETLAEMPVLSGALRKLFDMRRSSAATESWAPRLTGADP